MMTWRVNVSGVCDANKLLKEYKLNTILNVINNFSITDIQNNYGRERHDAFPGDEDGCEWICGCKKLNLASQQEQHMLLNSEPYLQPNVNVFTMKSYVKSSKLVISI